MAAPVNLSFEDGSGGNPDGWTITVLSSGYAWAGYYQVENRFTYSEQLDATAWAKTAATVTADATASPPGFAGTLSDELVEDGTTSEHKISEQLAGENGTAITVSIYAKASGRDFLWLGNASARAWFDLSTGATGTTTGGATSAIRTIGNGWFLCLASWTVGADPETIEIGTSLVDGAASYLGTSGTALELFGASLVRGTALERGAYLSTVATAGLLESIAEDFGSFWNNERHQTSLSDHTAALYSAPPLLTAEAFESFEALSGWDTDYLTTVSVSALATYGLHWNAASEHDNFDDFELSWAEVSADVSAMASSTVTSNSHGFGATDRVRFDNDGGGTLPAGVSASDGYFIKAVTANTFEVEDTIGGGSIALGAGFAAPVQALRSHGPFETTIGTSAAALYDATDSFDGFEASAGWDAGYETTIGTSADASYGTAGGSSTTETFEDDQAPVAFTVNTGTDLLLATAHPFSNTDRVTLQSTGALPDGLSGTPEYFVISANANDLQLSLTSGGAAIDITGPGTGTHELVSDPSRYWTNVVNF